MLLLWSSSSGSTPLKALGSSLIKVGNRNVVAFSPHHLTPLGACVRFCPKRYTLHFEAFLSPTRSLSPRPDQYDCRYEKPRPLFGPGQGSSAGYTRGQRHRPTFPFSLNLGLASSHKEPDSSQIRSSGVVCRTNPSFRVSRTLERP